MPVCVSGFESATALLQLLRDQQISAADLLRLYLERIERYNPGLNAIVTPDFERARQTAAAADCERKSGGARPLLGLPLTVKDCIDVAGLRGTAGVETYLKRIPARDAAVAARLREAGSVLLGKTNTPPFAADWQTFNPIFGRTNNPWDPERTPGGSTGGDAAAVAAGLTPLGFGSDNGGSIRIPAAFCGVYGHKPSETAVPRSGHFPGTTLPNAATAMSVQGPLARSAGDLELAMDVISGPEIGEDAAWRLNIPPPRHTRLSNYRVAIFPAIDWLPVDDSISSAIEQLCHRLSKAGAHVKQACPELLEDMRSHHQLYCSLLGVISAIGLTESERKQASEESCPSDEFDEDYSHGFVASALEYLAWHNEREMYRESFRSFYRDWDVLITPITLSTAFPHMHQPKDERRLRVAGKEICYNLQLVYPGIASLSGQPATAFPTGLGSDGLPVGLQAIGPYLEDRTPIRFTALLAQEFGGFQPPPGWE